MPPGRSDRLRERLIVFGLMTAVLALTVVALRVYPSPWLDEGLNWGAVRSLAETGRYGLDSADGFRPFATAIQTGPTVILPAVLTFEALGKTVDSVRLISALYGLVAVAAAYTLARRLFDSAPVAQLAVLLLLLGSAESSASFLPMARQFLGEVAALAWYLVGLNLWLAAPSEAGWRNPWIWAAGLSFGLAGLTKSQMALVFGPSWCLFALLSWWLHRRRMVAAFLLPLGAYVLVSSAWGGVQFIALGPDGFAAQSALLRETALIHVLTFDPQHWRAALGVLWRTGYFWWGIPALVWMAFRALRRDGSGQAALATLVFPVTALVWFVLLSIGWARYAFYPLTLTTLPLAGLLRDLWRGADHVAAGTRWLRRGAVAATVGALTLTGFVPFAWELARAKDDGFEAMRAYLKTQVSADAVVDTWEWPLAIDATPRFNYPAQETLNRVTIYIQDQHVRPPAGEFTKSAPGDQYVLIGPFGAWTGIYDTWVVGREPQAVFGSYALYDLATVP